MKIPRFAKWALVSFLPLGAVVGTAWLWHGPPSRPTTDKPGWSDAELAAEAATMIEAGNVSLIVDYQDDVSDAELAATPEVEQPISRWSASDRLYRVSFASPDAARQAAVRLGRDPRVESVGWDVEASIPSDERAQETAATEDRSMQAECGAANTGEHAGFPSDPCYRYQWHLRQLGLPAAWKLGQGAGAVVAVIDTGVSRVPDLADTPFVPGYNFVDDTDNAADDHGHGTHVAGTIAQSTHNKLGVGGVAFKASIMPLKVLSARGSGSMAAIAQAIRFAADHGAQVINMSLGGPFPVGAIGSAVKYARGKGVTVVAAAGNDGRGKVSYPARYPGVIAVAATQFDETTTFYSNWGPQVDVAAPGGNVRVDQNGDGKPDGVLQNTVVPGNTSRTDYLWFMGTSMATPHVAGVAALIVGAGVTKPDAVEQVLLDTARKPQGRGGGPAVGRVDDHYGAGLVDARAALTKVRAGRGAGELGLAGTLALLGLSFLARRGRGGPGQGVGVKVGAGFVAALVAGSSGLFLVSFVAPAWLSAWGGALNAASLGILDAADALLPSAWRGTPFIWSALVPVGLTGLLYGVPRLRGALAGLGFGVAGALLFAAIGSTFDVRVVPDVLDRSWLVANAALSAVVATAVLRR
ncbi:MAG: S8 family serine peptidase [Verrucomicrobiota bacterium]